MKVWVCSVCGYVHRADAPPESCPVCAAPGELLLEQKEEPVPVKRGAAAAFRCMNCEYIHHGAEAPESCPVCAAPAERFEVYEAEADAGAVSDSSVRIVIIGAGIAGVSAAEAIREHAPRAVITLLSNDRELPYYRLNLTRYLAGEITAAELPLKPAAWYAERNIELKLGCEVRSIDRERRTIALDGGNAIEYDRLIIASGSHGFMPPFAGSNRRNVTLLRTRRDADLILDYCDRIGRCVCIGGGVLGLETAGALARRGIQVTVLEGHEWLLPRQLNRRAGERLEAFARKQGIEFVKNARVTEFIGDDLAREAVLNNGSSLAADLFIIATGIRTNTYFARQCGLHVDGGIIADDFLGTSDAAIWAAGDAAQHRGVLYGTWGPAQYQGAIAGRNAVGCETRFDGIPRSNMLKVLGIDMFSIGTVNGGDASYSSCERVDGDHYYYFLLRDGRLIGAVLLGDTSLSAAVKDAIEKTRDFSALNGVADPAAELIRQLSARP